MLVNSNLEAVGQVGQYAEVLVVEATLAQLRALTAISINKWRHQAISLQTWHPKTKTCRQQGHLALHMAHDRFRRQIPPLRFHHLNARMCCKHLKTSTMIGRSLSFLVARISLMCGHVWRSGADATASTPLYSAARRVSSARSFASARAETLHQAEIRQFLLLPDGGDNINMLSQGKTSAHSSK